VDYCSSCGEDFEDGVEIIGDIGKGAICSTCFEALQEEQTIDVQAISPEPEEEYYGDEDYTFDEPQYFHQFNQESDSSVEIAEEIKQLDAYKKDEKRVTQEEISEDTEIDWDLESKDVRMGYYCMVCNFPFDWLDGDFRSSCESCGWSLSGHISPDIVAHNALGSWAIVESENWLREGTCEDCGKARFLNKGICEVCLNDRIQIFLDKANKKSLNTNYKYKAKSSKNPDKFYTVVREGQNYSCDCLGFNYRKRCRHIEDAKAIFPPLVEEQDESPTFSYPEWWGV